MSNINRFRNIKGIGQIKGPIPNKDDNGNLINLINYFEFTDNTSIIKLGIYAPVDTIVIINNKEFIIGKTEILEYETGANITFLAFKDKITKNVTINFVTKI